MGRMDYWLFSLNGGDVPSWIAPLLGMLFIWSLFWKGLALWHSARRSEQWWYIVMLVISTAGILEIFYLFVFARIPSTDLFSFRSASKSEADRLTPRRAHTQP